MRDGRSRKPILMCDCCGERIDGDPPGAIVTTDGVKRICGPECFLKLSAAPNVCTFGALDIRTAELDVVRAEGAVIAAKKRLASLRAAETIDREYVAQKEREAQEMARAQIDAEKGEDPTP